uniref:Post-SET domain-containing protein n=1 Tax=Acrobeloides nanus TaxID=290746 RepID=A0A914DVR2_9BILA
MRSGFAPSGDCDKQIQYDEAIGEIATTTCLCTGEKCNFSMAYRTFPAKIKESSADGAGASGTKFILNGEGSIR